MSKNNLVVISLIGVISLGLVLILLVTVLPQKQAKTDVKPETQTSQKIVSRSGQISVLLPKETQVGLETKADIMIDTGGEEINGFDVILTFDPMDWQVLSSQIKPAEGEDFSIYPLNKIDLQNGRIEFSGLTAIGNSFHGRKIVGSLLLRAKRSGKLNIEVEFIKPGEGNDSNLAGKKNQQDILGKVTAGQITVN